MRALGIGERKEISAPRLHECPKKPIVYVLSRVACDAEVVRKDAIVVKLQIVAFVVNRGK